MMLRPAAWIIPGNERIRSSAFSQVPSRHQRIRVGGATKVRSWAKIGFIGEILRFPVNPNCIALQMLKSCSNWFWQEILHLSFLCELIHLFKFEIFWNPLKWYHNITFAMPQNVVVSHPRFQRPPNVLYLTNLRNLESKIEKTSYHSWKKNEIHMFLPKSWFFLAKKCENDLKNIVF